MRRRSLILTTLAGAAASVAAREPRPGTTGGPLRLACDLALADSGLARSLQLAFSGDTGIAVQVLAGPSLPVLDALAAGEFDAALTNAVEAETKLDTQGLVYDRRSIASGEFIIVGPAPEPKGRDRPASVKGRSAAAALAALNEVASAQPDAVVFLSANDGSGTHVVEQAAWRLAQVAPQAPWYRTAAAGTSLVAQARAQNAYAIVERGAWMARGGAPLTILVDGDPALAESVHAMRSFRSPHPAGKIFVAWIAGGRGHAVVAAHHGYRVPRP